MGHEKGLKKAHCDGESSLSVISTATMAIRSPKTEYQYRVRNNEIAAWMPLTLALKGAARNSNTPGIMRPKVIMVLAPVCSKKWKTAASRMVRAKGTVYRAHRAVYSRAWRIAAGPGARCGWSRGTPEGGVVHEHHELGRGVAEGGVGVEGVPGVCLVFGPQVDVFGECGGIANGKKTSRQSLGGSNRFSDSVETSCGDEAVTKHPGVDA